MTPQRACEILELTNPASAAEIRSAYHDLVKVWHPDRFAHDPALQTKAQGKLTEINEAYKTLTSGAHSEAASAPTGGSNTTHRNRSSRRDSPGNAWTGPANKKTDHGDPSAASGQLDLSLTKTIALMVLFVFLGCLTAALIMLVAFTLGT